MNERTQSLFPSLVGASIDYSFRNKVSAVLDIDENIAAAKSRIGKEISLAHETGGKLAILLLAELTSYYTKQVYYMAVRSSIEMRRYRPMVLEYLNLSIEERAEKLKEVLSESIRKDRNRELKIMALKYFLSTYSGRIKEFKKLLTREEFINIC